MPKNRVPELVEGALVRSGIGAIDIVDDDRICLTNSPESLEYKQNLLH